MFAATCYCRIQCLGTSGTYVRLSIYENPMHFIGMAAKFLVLNKIRPTVLDIRILRDCIMACAMKLGEGDILAVIK